MPVKKIKYTCEYRCHHRAIADIKKMIIHERCCWFNPENRTCKSCIHESYDREDYFYERWCPVKGGQAEVEVLLEKLDARAEAEYQEELKDYNSGCLSLEDIVPVKRRVEDSPIPPVIGCKFWQNKRGKR